YFRPYFCPRSAVVLTDTVCSDSAMPRSAMTWSGIFVGFSGLLTLTKGRSFRPHVFAAWHLETFPQSRSLAEVYENAKSTNADLWADCIALCLDDWDYCSSRSGSGGRALRQL